MFVVVTAEELWTRLRQRWEGCTIASLQHYKEEAPCLTVHSKSFILSSSYL